MMFDNNFFLIFIVSSFLIFLSLEKLSQFILIKFKEEISKKLHDN